MRQAKIFFKGKEAGILTQNDDGSFRYRYNDQWIVDTAKPPISLTLPKTEQGYRSEHLFPFFLCYQKGQINKWCADICESTKMTISGYCLQQLVMTP